MELLKKFKGFSGSMISENFPACSENFPGCWQTSISLRGKWQVSCWQLRWKNWFQRQCLTMNGSLWLVPIRCQWHWRIVYGQWPSDKSIVVSIPFNIQTTAHVCYPVWTDNWLDSNWIRNSAHEAHVIPRKFVELSTNFSEFLWKPRHLLLRNFRELLMTFRECPKKFRELPNEIYFRNFRRNVWKYLGSSKNFPESWRNIKIYQQPQKG